MNQRSAQLHLETSKLMGVDFLPISKRIPILDKTIPTTLETLRVDHDNHCPHCTASTSHTQTVFGTGNENADLMFIGEAPGAEEDAQGVPFVGAAGQKLNQIIEELPFTDNSKEFVLCKECKKPDTELLKEDRLLFIHCLACGAKHSVRSKI